MKIMEFNSLPQSLYQVWEKEHRPLEFIDTRTAAEHCYLKVASAPPPYVISLIWMTLEKSLKCVALQSTHLSNDINIFLLEGQDITY